MKDDKTAYSFDTSAIEHLEYPRDLRFSQIIEFKEKLAEKIKATHQSAISDPNYSTFLKHFGAYTVPKLDKKEVSGQEYIIDELRSLRVAMRRLEYGQGSRESGSQKIRQARMTGDLDICMGGSSEAEVADAVKRASEHPDIREIFVDDRGTNHKHIIANMKPGATVTLELEKLIGGRARRQRSPKRSIEKKIAKQV